LRSRIAAVKETEVTGCRYIQLNKKGSKGVLFNNLNINIRRVQKYINQVAVGSSFLECTWYFSSEYFLIITHSANLSNSFHTISKAIYTFLN